VDESPWDCADEPDGCALLQADLQPMDGDWLVAFTDGRCVRPDVGWRHQADQGRSILQENTLARGIRNAFHLTPADLPAGLGLCGLQLTIVGESQKAFAVTIPASGGINPGLGRQGGRGRALRASRCATDSVAVATGTGPGPWRPIGAWDKNRRKRRWSVNKMSGTAIWLKSAWGL